jgi:hypothetical protein
MSSKKINKSQFVRDAGDKPAAEIVALAKKNGVKLTENYVYTIRSAAKKRAGAKSGRRGAIPEADGGQTHRSKKISNTPSETGFLELALDIGLGRAQTLLDQIRVAARNA